MFNSIFFFLDFLDDCRNITPNLSPDSSAHHTLTVLFHCWADRQVILLRWFFCLFSDKKLFWDTSPVWAGEFAIINPKKKNLHASQNLCVRSKDQKTYWKYFTTANVPKFKSGKQILDVWCHITMFHICCFLWKD